MSQLREQLQQTQHLLFCHTSRLRELLQLCVNGDVFLKCQKQQIFTQKLFLQAVTRKASV